MRGWADTVIFWVVVVVAANIAWRIADPIYLFPIAIPLGLCMLGLVKVIRMIAASVMRRFAPRADDTVRGP